MNFFVNLKCIRRYSTLPSIYAVASGSNQRCGVAVVRLSGTKSFNILNKLTNMNENNNLNKLIPNKMYYKNIYHPVSKLKIDTCLVVWFQGPKSFTGEDVCEFHLHGGPSIISLFFNALSTFDGIRIAEPGEFSKRAFLNGKMDLTEAEGLADLINAETEMQRQQALNQMQGSLSKFYNECKDKIIKCLANVEAYIDFHEEENIEEDVLNEVEKKLEQIRGLIQHHLNDNRKGERLRNGIRAVIIGEPNAGKSSLLNSICQKPAAIVSPIPGTTRDIVESALNIGGYPIILSDTAGLRQTSDIIEQEGVRRAKDRVNVADILILIVDIKLYIESIERQGIFKFIEQHLSNLLSLNLEHIDNIKKEKVILVAFNKTDLLNENIVSEVKSQISKSFNSSIFVTTISCLNESTDGINEFLDVLKKQLDNLCLPVKREMPLITQQRHRDNLAKCIECIDLYLDKSFINIDDDIVLKAEYLRSAIKYISTITGQITTEHVLDVIFKDFCIGK